ncbi:MAG: ABC transporter permease [Thermomicrobiales bacterium]
MEFEQAELETLARPDATGEPPGEETVRSGAGAERSIYVASQWRLMWWKFKRHRLAMVGGALVILLYLVAIFAEFLAPADPNKVQSSFTYAPPQLLHVVDTSGGWDWGLFVYGYSSKIDQATLSRTYVIDDTKKVPVGFFVKGNEYKLFGLVSWDRHLIGPKDPTKPMYILGADRLGQDLLSRMIYGTRVSMSIGLIGVFISLVLGLILGGVSGYVGGKTDTVIQRLIEFVRSVPTIPLWMGLAAALPKTWSALQVYFGITLILSIIGWTGLARVVRGRFLSLREEEFVTAARLDGSSELRIIVRHMMPSFFSHIIASLTLAIPATILAETTLSFLGLGLRSPINSWGVLLEEAQNIRSISQAPWLLLPGGLVIVAVLALNFLGDGLRDAADPYTT